jgi:dolichyl-phosphate-mannose-protein mannosyltransferase
VSSTPSIRAAASVAPKTEVAATQDILLIAALVFFCGLAAFLFDLGSPAKIYFDETWYVPTARAWLATGSLLHPEHPPLGKLLISASVDLFGDTPLGWRILSAVFGALTLVAVFFWTLALLDSLKAALWAAALTLVDQIIYVQSRIAMLDIFLIAFVTFGLAAFTFAMRNNGVAKARVGALASGVCFGLAGACKISGFFPLLGTMGLCVIVAAVRRRHGSTLLCAPGADQVLRPGFALLAFVVAPVFAYLLTFTPQALHNHSLVYFVSAQHEMFHVMLGHSATHPYSSLWYSWPIQWRPVWYLFDAPDGDADNWDEDSPAAAVVALANPLIVYAGESAIAWLIWRALWREDFRAGVVVVAFLSQWLPWIVNPKGLEFSYYFFPSIVCLGPALALVFFRRRNVAGEVAGSVFLLFAAVLFLFFLPVLESSLGVTPDDLDARAWLSSWR